jgi:hypothetical protein
MYDIHVFFSNFIIIVACGRTQRPVDSHDEWGLRGDIYGKTREALKVLYCYLLSGTKQFFQIAHNCWKLALPDHYHVALSGTN